MRAARPGGAGQVPRPPGSGAPAPAPRGAAPRSALPAALRAGGGGSPGAAGPHGRSGAPPAAGQRGGAVSAAPRSPGAAAGGGYARGMMMIDTQVSCAFRPSALSPRSTFTVPPRSSPGAPVCSCGGGGGRSPSRIPVRRGSRWPHACPRRVTDACAVPGSGWALSAIYFLGVCSCRCLSLAACWCRGALRASNPDPWSAA